MGESPTVQRGEAAPPQAAGVAGFDVVVSSSLLTVGDKVEHYEVREVDVDLRLSAFLPDTFVTEPKARLDLLREMDAAQTPDAAVAIGLSIMDRFGSLPEPVETLLLVFLLKHRADLRGQLL